MTLLVDPISLDTVTIAPFALLRAAGLPFEAVDQIGAFELSDAVRSAAEAIAAMASTAAGLTDALHAAVPAAAPLPRRLLLKVKRAVHNGRPLQLDAAGAEAVAAAVPVDMRPRLASWFSHARQALTAGNEVARLLDEGCVGALRARMRATLDDPDFACGMVLARVELYRRLRRTTGPAGGQVTKDEQALLGYIARAAGKTSPFSTFMTWSLVGTGTGPGPALPAGTHMDRTVTVSRTTLSLLAQAQLRVRLAGGEQDLEVSPTLRRVGRDHIEALAEDHAVINNRLWRQQRQVRVAMHPTVIDVLLQPGRQRMRAATLTAELVQAGLPAERAQGLVERCTRRGFLRAAPALDAFDVEPPPGTDPAGAPAASTDGGGGAGPDGQMVLDLAAGARRLAAGGPDERAEVLARASAALHEQIGPEMQAMPGRSGWMFNEETWLAGTADGAGGGGGNLGQATLAQLTRLGQWLKTQVVVKPEYRQLQDAFLSRYGEGGECDDLVGFLADSYRHMFQSAREGLGRGQRDAARSRKVAVTALVQVAAPDPRELDEGGGTLVVNRVYEGPAWLAARHAHGPRPSQAELRRSLAEWVAVCGEGRTPMDVPISGECSDLQAHPILTGMICRWPGEPVRAGRSGVVDAADLRLVRNPTDGHLRVLAPDGREVAPLLLGAAFPTPAWGIPFLLGALGQPYAIKRPHFGLPADGTDVEHRERMVAWDSDLVIRRESWWVRSSRLCEALSGGTADRLVRLAALFARDGIPPWVFAQAVDTQRDRIGAAIDIRKPLLLHAHNPVYLSSLDRLAAAAPWVVFEEMLPGPGQLWLERDGKRYVSEFHVEMTL